MSDNVYSVNPGLKGLIPKPDKDTPEEGQRQIVDFDGRLIPHELIAKGGYRCEHCGEWFHWWDGELDQSTALIFCDTDCAVAWHDCAKLDDYQFLKAAVDHIDAVIPPGTPGWKHE